MSTPLTNFLFARVSEDEAVARSAIGHLVDIGAGHEDIAVLHHIDRWTSERVLAECAAKRRVAEDYLGMREIAKNIARERGDQDGEAMVARNIYAGLDMALRSLALPYADHPDFNAEWRP
jgi:hypothetical protein